MTDSNKPSRQALESERQVLDPEWEEELRRGQEAEGGAGSVEPELEMVHLLRHLREPEAISAEALDTIWADIEAEVAPQGLPWWRKAWVWWAAPVAVAAAVLVIAVLPPGQSDEANTIARNDDIASEDKAAPAPMAEAKAEAELEEEESERDEASRGAKQRLADDSQMREGGLDGIAGTPGGAAQAAAPQNAFESNYVRLQPQGRAAIRVAVDASRDDLRDQLLATARGGGR